MTERQKTCLQAEWSRQFDAFATAVARMADGDRGAMALIGRFYDKESVEDDVRDMRSALSSVTVSRLPNGRWCLGASLGQGGTFFESHCEIGEGLSKLDAVHLAFGAEGRDRLVTNAVYWHRRLAECGCVDAAARLSELKRRASQRRREIVKRSLRVGCWTVILGTLAFFLVASVVAHLFF